mgnify:FL=1|jgi:hypothetical protein|tara:strand:- start:51 stop:341 length:291 start_codon:yes stop_codon:yes gene_type:complete
MTKVFFVLFVILLGLELAAPSAFARRGLSNGQVNRRAHIIVQQLKKEDPRVLRAVMYHMGWVPRLKYKREQRKRQQNPNTFDEWYIDMMRDLGGIR